MVRKVTGNGLLLHSAIAVELEQGQPLGLFWQKVWHRGHRTKPPADETPSKRNNDTPKLARPNGLERLPKKNPIDGSKQ